MSNNIILVFHVPEKFIFSFKNESCSLKCSWGTRAAQATPGLRRLIVLAAEDLIMDYLGRTLLSQVGVT